VLRKIFGYGLIAGLIVGLHMFVLGFVMKGHMPGPWGMVVGYLTMLIALSTVFIAIKRQRDIEQGGVIKFWSALGLGLGISLIASLLYVATWELVQMLSHMDFAGSYAKATLEEQQAKGVSGAELEAMRLEMERFKVQYADPLFRLPMTFIEIFPVGVLVSLISAGLLCNSRFLPARKV
jgi:hypothetical protein